MGSFDRAHILRHFPSGIEPFIVETQVPCCSFLRLCDRNKVDHIDLLHIDTEGHDYVILQQVDLPTYRPQVILFEHRHLSHADQVAAQELLARNGYRWYCDNCDCIALRKS